MNLTPDFAASLVATAFIVRLAPRDEDGIRPSPDEINRPDPGRDPRRRGRNFPFLSDY